MNPSYYSVLYKGGTAAKSLASKNAIYNTAKQIATGKSKYQEVVHTICGGVKNWKDPVPYLKWSGDGVIELNNLWKVFDYDGKKVTHTQKIDDDGKIDYEAGPYHFHVPIYVQDAVRSYANVAHMNTTWLLDYHMRKFEEAGLEYIQFTFDYPATDREVLTINDILKFRRKFVVDKVNGMSKPSIQQVMRVEDIDRIIERVHGSTHGFNPRLNQAATRKVVTRWGIDEKSAIWFNDSNHDDHAILYNWIWKWGKPQYGVTFNYAAPNGGQPTIEKFLDHPQTNDDLRECYKQLVDIMTERLDEKLPWTGHTPKYEFWYGGNEKVHEILKIDKIMEKLRTKYELPEGIFTKEEDNIRTIVKQRLIQQILRCMFETWARATKDRATWTKRFRNVIYHGQKLVYADTNVFNTKM